MPYNGNYMYILCIPIAVSEWKESTDRCHDIFNQLIPCICFQSKQPTCGADFHLMLECKLWFAKQTWSISITMHLCLINSPPNVIANHNNLSNPRPRYPLPHTPTPGFPFPLPALQGANIPVKLCPISLFVLGLQSQVCSNNNRPCLHTLSFELCNQIWPQNTQLLHV